MHSILMIFYRSASHLLPSNNWPFWYMNINMDDMAHIYIHTFHQSIIQLWFMHDACKLMHMWNEGAHCQTHKHLIKIFRVASVMSRRWGEGNERGSFFQQLIGSGWTLTSFMYINTICGKNVSEQWRTSKQKCQGAETTQVMDATHS